MDYLYSADINPSEQELNLLCKCSCEYEDFQDVIAYVGHSETSWAWECPNCGTAITSYIDNDKIFD